MLICSFSGGKDSTAMLHLLMEQGRKPDKIYFFDTGWEFPAMYDHIKLVEKKLKVTIEIKRPPKPFLYYMLFEPTVKGGTGYGWPRLHARWCTGLKKSALNKDVPKDAVTAVGLAADETKRAEKAGMQKGKIFPLIEAGMTEADCLRFCYAEGYSWGGLYEEFQRVSCFCCPLQRIGDLQNLRERHSDLWKKMLQWDTVCENRTAYKNYKNKSVKGHDVWWNLAQWDAYFESEEEKRVSQEMLFK